MPKEEKEALSMGDIERYLVRLAARVDQPRGMDPVKANCLRAIYECLANLKREERKTWWQSRVALLWEERQRLPGREDGLHDA